MNKKHQILIDVERLKYPTSGLANVCRSLIKGLDDISREFSYTLYGPKRNFPKAKFNFSYIQWKFWQKFVPIKISSFDLIHTTHQLSDYFHTQRKNQKKVVTLHDLNFLHDKSSSKKKAKTTKLIQKNLQNADAIICISEFVKQDFLTNKHLFKLKPNVNISVIYNGLIFPEKLVSSAFQYDFIGKKYLLTIGVLFPKKNQHVLLNLLSSTDRDLVLITSSAKSHYKQQFLDKVKELNLEKRVHILENVSDDDKYYIIQNCESYCHPSLAEGFGIPPIEAMWLGKPVFLSRLTSLPEIAGELAFYFDCFDKEHMCEVYTSGMKTYYATEEEYQKKLKARALSFDYKSMAEAYQMLYKKLLDK